MVTGAAAGIGRATAERFHAAGFWVGAYDVDEAGLATLAAELGPERLVTGRLDVTDAAGWRSALEGLTAESGGVLDVLVNNAGVLASGPFEEIDLDRQQRMVAINVGGVLNGCHTAYPFLTGADDARIVNLCSASAIYGQAELATYSATKFAVRGLTEALDLEWGPRGIRLVALWPLFVATGMVDGMDIGSTRSLGVRLTADDVAAAVVAAATDVPRLPLPHGVHRPVGAQARALFATAQLAPSWALRLVNRRVTGH